MARRPRIDIAGYHHLVNRGVARSDVYKCKADKDKFLEILCKACREYKANVHDYCLMDNHYHLLIETKQDNLSLLMRQINSNYASFFNKKYKRVGHLWQGRYKSWYIVQDEYLYMLFRYIEFNPIKANMTSTVGEYEYTLASTIINNSILPCAKYSMLIREFTSETMIEFLALELSEDELAKLDKEKNRTITIEDDKLCLSKSKSLDKHFHKCELKEARNNSMLDAFRDGYTQSKIAKYLGVSAGLVSMILKEKTED